MFQALMKHFICVNSFDLHNNLMRWLSLKISRPPPFFFFLKKTLAQLNNLTKVIQIVIELGFDPRPSNSRTHALNYY